MRSDWHGSDGDCTRDVDKRRPRSSFSGASSIAADSTAQSSPLASPRRRRVQHLHHARSFLYHRGIPTLRGAPLSDPACVDLLIIGGGINGVGIARDAVGRGLSVTLVEQADLASGTSSASTKLIHGGLRYLEYYEFRLVREALQEREVLWRVAPHIIWPLRFVLPHHRGLRPAWLLRLGLFLYDHLGGRKLLPATRGLDLRS